MPNPPIAAQTRSGPVDRVPCPWCNKANDFRPHDHLLQSDDPIGVGNMDFNCDFCNQPMRVVKVARVMTVFVRQGKKA